MFGQVILHNSLKILVCGILTAVFCIEFCVKTLADALVGRKYKICGFDGQADKVLLRFFELGFLPGEEVKIVATSLQKKVCLIEIRGYVLSVRRSLLSKVQVKDA